MATMDGRSASYVPGKEVPNREPPGSRFVVEKLYRVHRERLAKTEPLVDSHMHIPEFMKNQEWKKNGEKQKRNMIAKHNQEIYERIAKVENAESQLTTASRKHIRRVEIKLAYLKKLKEHGRMVNVMKIQRENEHLMVRIGKAVPEYSRKKCDEWYEHHKMFKEGRRSDPGAGHIMKGMSDVMPKKLPPAPAWAWQVGSKSDRIDSLASSLMDNSSMAGSKKSKRTLPPLSSSVDTAGTGTLASSQQQQQQQSYASSSVRSSSQGRTSSNRPLGSSNSPKKQQTKKNKQMVRVASVEKEEDENISVDSRLSNHSRLSQGSSSLAMENRRQSLVLTPFIKKKEIEEVRRGRAQSMGADSTAANGGAASGNSVHFAENGAAISGVADETDESVRSGVGSSMGSRVTEQDLHLISSRLYSIPFDTKSCVVHVYLSKKYSENLFLKCMSVGASPSLYSERQIGIDKAYDVLNSTVQTTNIMQSTDSEDLWELSAMLISMFEEADKDKCGFLTSDEFLELMDKVDLGISGQELTFVVNEADENENGVVDFEEFVPLAVDLILSFRARSKAKVLSTQMDVYIDEQIQQEIQPKELQELSYLCLEKIYEFDTKKYGLIRVPELKKCLSGLLSSGLKESEISNLCQVLPRDQFGRCKYNTPPGNFLEVLTKVRFTTLKNVLVEEQGSGLQNYLLEVCREEEFKLHQLKNESATEANFAPTGAIPSRSLIQVLSTSSRLSLSRLQVLVLMSEAAVMEGMINYFQFIPIVAKAIELMFEPRSLRQRAELIEKTDLSPEALVAGMQSDQFEQRLLTLFKSYDIDKTGGLDTNEFLACLESLELQLTLSEMNVLFAQADVSSRGCLTFDDFMRFFLNNLPSLEKERHVRLLDADIKGGSTVASTLSAAAPAHRRKGSDGSIGSLDHSLDSTDAGLSDEDKEIHMFRSELMSIFKLSDPDQTDLLPLETIESLLRSFHIQLSKVLVEVMMHELHHDESGMVDYVKSLDALTDLFRVYKAKQKASKEHDKMELHAKEQAVKIAASLDDDLTIIVKYLREKIKHIIGRFPDPSVQATEVKNLLLSAQTGLSKQESNYLVNKLVTNAKMQGDASSSSHSATTSHSHAAHHHHHSSSSHDSPFNYSASHLLAEVRRARTTSLLRHIMEEVDHNDACKFIEKSLWQEHEKLVHDGQLPALPASAKTAYLPVDNCFAVLEGAHSLRLHKAQIMFIISWAECFDKECKSLDILRFAKHSAALISQLTGHEMADVRHEVVSQSDFDEEKIFNGSSEREIGQFLETRFTSMCDESKQITISQLNDTIKAVPMLTFSDREVATIVSSFKERAKYIWTDVLPLVMSTIHMLCRERLINRRVSLAVMAVTNKPPAVDSSSTVSAESAAKAVSMSTTTGGIAMGGGRTDNKSRKTRSIIEDSTKRLKDVVDRLLNVVKIAVNSGQVNIVLPFDATDKRSSTGRTAGSADDSEAAGDSNKPLFSGSKLMKHVIVNLVMKPITKQEKHSMKGSVGGGVTASSSGNAGTASTRASISSEKSFQGTGPGDFSAALAQVSGSGMTEEQIQETMMPVQIDIVADEETDMSVGVALHAHITSTGDAAGDNDVVEHQIQNVSLPLPMKLPSIAMVDIEAAAEFASNMFERLYLETRAGVMSLKLDTDK